MASVTAMRQAIKATVKAAIPSLNVYDTVPDVTQLPALVVMPHTGHFLEAMQRGHDKWEFELFILVAIPTVEFAQDQLDPYITGAGPNSIREVFYMEPTLGDVVIDAVVSGVDKYGGHYQTCGIPHIGACLRLEVLTSGTD